MGRKGRGERALSDGSTDVHAHAGTQTGGEGWVGWEGGGSHLHRCLHLIHQALHRCMRQPGLVKVLRGWVGGVGVVGGWGRRGVCVCERGAARVEPRNRAAQPQRIPHPRPNPHTRRTRPTWLRGAAESSLEHSS